MTTTILVLAICYSTGLPFVCRAGADGDEPAAVPQEAVQVRRALEGVRDELDNLPLEGAGRRDGLQRLLVRLDKLVADADSTDLRCDIQEARLEILAPLADRGELFRTYLLSLYLARDPRRVVPLIWANSNVALTTGEQARPAVIVPSTQEQRAAALIAAYDHVCMQWPGSEAYAAARLATARVLRSIGREEDATKLLEAIALEGKHPDEAQAAKALLWEGRYVRIGSRPPLTAWTDALGTEVSLSTLGGTPVVIYAWTRRCGACREALDRIREVSRLYGDSVRFLGVNFDESKAEFTAGVSEKQPPGTQVFMRDQVESTRWPIMSFPRILVLDANGKTLQGDQDPSKLLEFMRSLCGSGAK